MTEQQDKIYGIISQIMRLESALKEHMLIDELCGNHIVISTDITDEFIVKLKNDVTGACHKELAREGTNHRYCESEKPLVDAILLMNTKKDEEPTGDTNEPDTSNSTRETNLGEIPKFKPFGGIKIDET